MTYAFTTNDYKQMGILNEELLTEMERIEPKVTQVLYDARSKFFPKIEALQKEMYEFVNEYITKSDMEKLTEQARVNKNPVTASEQSLLSQIEKEKEEQKKYQLLLTLKKESLETERLKKSLNMGFIIE